MIVKPTVNELLEHAENRFATSRRARQIANGDKKLTDVEEESPVTIAANEINEGKVSICEELEDEQESKSETEIEEEEEQKEEVKEDSQEEQEDEGNSQDD